MAGEVEPYLAPYIEAAARHGGGFRSLLWASPKTQRARFAAIERVAQLDGRVVLDAGCGRADLLKFLLERGVRPFEYVGLEAVETLARAAEQCRFERARILRGDFVSDPLRLCVGAENHHLQWLAEHAERPGVYATLPPCVHGQRRTSDF